MGKFLEELANYINQSNASSMVGCCIVFPSRRAGVYFLKYLADLNEKPGWAPSVLTMGEMVQELSGQQPIDKLSLIVELYQVFIRQSKSSESFDNFYFWGEMLLSDFDDIDKQLVNARDLFQNISDLKKIEADLSYLSDSQVEAIQTFWKNFEGGRHSSEKENFSQLWKEMYNIYSQFKASLKNSGKAFEGMLYRELIEKIMGGNEPEIGWKKIYIAGFNILNECEKSLFRFLQKKKIVEFFWDYDELYIEDTDHEAGVFMRENLQDFPSSLPAELFRNLRDPGKKVQIIAESSQTGQAVTAGTILEKLSLHSEINFKNTALVLADESLLLPCIYSIPDSCPDVNITMGLQVTDTPIYSYMESIISLSQNARVKYGKSQYYHRDIINFIKNRYLRDEREKLHALEENILASNKVYLYAEEISITDSLAKIFPVPTKTKEFIGYLRKILYELFSSLPEAEEDQNPDISLLEKESVYSVFMTVCRLEEIFQKSGIELKLPTFRVLLRKLLKQQKINFSGEPLHGLQLMGLLETRCLDFENVILLSANEDILPKKSSLHSFIPYSLRKGFGMSIPERQDAMFAYYFYRLLQRSTNIFLIYNSISSGMNKAEMSRYLYQLKFSSPYQLTEKSQVHIIGTLLPKVIRIEKKERVLGKLKEFEFGNRNSHSLSPSALCTFLDCSLKFYFRYIAGIKTSKEIVEEIDKLSFGKILHEAIAKLYAKHTNHLLDKQELSGIMKNQELIENIVEEAIQKVTNPDKKGIKAEISGKNLIVSEILKKYISRIIYTDIQAEPLEILELERKVSISFAARAGNEPIFVNLGGIIDRTDRSNGILRIIDYKTGGKPRAFKSLSELTDPANGINFHPAFQVLTYCLVLSKEKKTEAIQPGLYYLKDIFSNEFDSRLMYKTEKETRLDSYETIANEFEKLLLELLNRIFDPAQPFEQTNNLKTCENCEFAQVCHRD